MLGKGYKNIGNLCRIKRRENMVIDVWGRLCNKNKGISKVILNYLVWVAFYVNIFEIRLIEVMILVVVFFELFIWIIDLSYWCCGLI